MIVYDVLDITIEATSTDSKGVGGKDPNAEETLITAPRPRSSIEGNTICVI